MDRQRLHENGRPQLVYVVTPPLAHQGGTDGVLAIDLRNMLFSINIDSAGPIARNGRLIRASLGVLCQTVANTAGRPCHGNYR
jgi:hypothetical protein